MQVTFEAKCQLTLNHNKGENKSSHVSTDFNLCGFSENLDERMYMSDGVPTEAGVKVLIEVFTQGLVGAITYAAQKGVMAVDEGVRHVTEMIKSCISENPISGESEFKNTNHV